MRFIQLPMIYLFIGSDEISKQRKIRLLKQQLLNPKIESFNYEVLEGKDLSKSMLKEAFCRLPVSSKSRIIVINNILKLKENSKDCLLAELKNLPGYLTIVLDSPAVAGKRDAFIDMVSKVSKVFSFEIHAKKDVFALCRAVERKQPEFALNLLSDLFKAGEKPEKIMGGLRYHFVRSDSRIEDRIKKIKMLLDADIKIKTGRLKPEFAVEVLVVKLCV